VVDDLLMNATVVAARGRVGQAAERRCLDPIRVMKIDLQMARGAYLVLT
jgi:hypothetical protein